MVRGGRMTAKEAFEIRKNPDYHMSNEKWLELSQCIDHALEKQIPKKPTLKKHTNRVPDEQDEYYCPNCDEWFAWHWKFKYCACCGQAIDWSEVE